MKDKEGFELQALQRPSSTAQVVSLSDMDFFLIVDLPVMEDYKVYSIEELDSRDDNVFEFPDYMWKQEGVSKLRINSAALKRQPGYHEYRVNLINTITDITTHLYFSYIVQTTKHDRDYIYMEDSRKELNKES